MLPHILSASLTASPPCSPAAAPPRGQLDGASLARCATAFERIDKNRDGLLSRIEIVQARPNIE